MAVSDVIQVFECASKCVCVRALLLGMADEPAPARVSQGSPVRAASVDPRLTDMPNDLSKEDKSNYIN